MVLAQAAHLVQRDQHLVQELLVLVFERQREPVDDAVNDRVSTTSDNRELSLAGRQRCSHVGPGSVTRNDNM